MSEQVNGEGQANQGEHQDSQGTETLESLQKKFAEVQATNNRLLEESKKNKAKSKEYEAQLESERLEKFKNISSAEEKVKALEEMYKKSEEKRKAMEKKALNEAILSRVMQAAPDAYDYKDLLAQTEFAPILIDGVDEENLTIKDESVKTFISKVREAKPYMFKPQQQVGTFNKKPTTEVKQTKNEIPKDKGDILKLLNEKWGNDKSLF